MKSKFQFYIYARDGFKNVCNHIFMSFSSVLTLIITLSLCAVVFMFVVNTNAFTRDIESQVTMLAEFNYDVTEAQITSVMHLLDHHELVYHHEFIDRYTEREEVVSQIVGDNDELRYLFERTSNTLADIVIIEAVNITALDLLEGELLVHPYLQSVQHPSDAAELISGTTNAIRVVMMVFAGVLMLLAIFLIHNTIKITIYSRQEELSIMRLVGASIGHITFPFLIEGLIIGVIGAIFPILFTMIGYSLVYDLNDGIFAINIFQLASPSPLVYQVGFVMGIISILVSLLGSLFAVAKYALKD
ncbi:MAG: hypothetical protein FWG67_03260 [Defluviitaleaceae bacterium]|nr:hypothetical protein [Defluviitaleaceae bacterium]